MDIDITTVVAQIVNFVVLIWLLTRFLYRPIVSTIDAREKAVTSRLDDARLRREAADRQMAEYQKKQAELEKGKEAYLEEARAEAAKVRGQLLDQAASEAEAAKRRYADMLMAERREMELTLQEELVKQVSQVTGALIRDMAGKSLEDGLIDAFEKELEKERPDWSRSGDKPLIVRLSFEPDAAQKKRLWAIVARSMGDPQQPGDEPGITEFVLDPKLILGIEIEHNGSIVTWSAESYIDRLESRAIKSLNDAPPGPTEVAEHA